MFNLDIIVWQFLTETFKSWCTINGAFTGFLPAAIIGVYGSKIIAEFKAEKAGSKSVFKTKR